MGHMPCRVEHDLMARDAREAESERDDAAVTEACAELRAEILDAILTRDMTAPVTCASSRGEPITQTLDEAVFGALAAEKAGPLVLALLRSDAGKALREFIADEHVRMNGDVIGLSRVGAI